MAMLLVVFLMAFHGSYSFFRGKVLLKPIHKKRDSKTPVMGDENGFNQGGYLQKTYPCVNYSGKENHH